MVPLARNEVMLLCRWPYQLGYVLLQVIEKPINCGLNHRTFTVYLARGLEVGGSKVDAAVPWSMGPWVCVSAILQVSSWSKDDCCRSRYSHSHFQSQDIGRQECHKTILLGCFLLRSERGNLSIEYPQQIFLYSSYARVRSHDHSS